MPTTMVRETTVFTLAELKALDDGTYETAIEKIQTLCWEWFEPDTYTEDLEYQLDENFPVFELTKGSGKERWRGQTLFWDMDRMTVEFEGDIDIKRFMTERKLRNKYRSLWYVLDTYFVSPSIGVSYGKGRDIILDDIRYDTVYHLELTYAQENQPRYTKIEAQITAMENELEDYVGEIASKLRENMRLEQKWRWSEEYAVEEADVHEFKFTEDGKIYHG